ncbi:MAG: hypothetical protein ACOX52_00195 [Verrucomicrobiota bacterium]
MPSWAAQTSLPSCVISATAFSGFVCPNPIPRLFDTDTDSDPDPDFALPLAFSDDL